jgi:transcriptional regulator with XRE-family HTH domain
MGVKDVFTEFEPFEISVAEELRTQRRRANISLKEMAEKIGLHSNTIAKCEKHEFGLGLDILYGYAKVLECPLASFLGRHDLRERSDGNPLAELTQEEMILYSQVLQDLFHVFAEHGLKLSSGLSFAATRLAAMAIIEQHRDS